ncbi:unnamed protein product [Symbiodinium natans]|uniref:Uncharacterized protein n=1 Tax=Symbiodinium natans TaxID=878477 RepID=A0A812UBZ8_9DINO|nr:unnamed protein product [Symbiodinium natans]
MSCAQSGTDGPFDVKIDGDKIDVDEVCPFSDDRQEDEGDQSNQTLVELPDSPRSYLQHFLQQAASNSEVIEEAQLKDTIHSASSSSVSHRAWTGRLYQEICEQLRQIQSTKGYTTEGTTDSINQIQSGLSRVHSHPSIEAKHTPSERRCVSVASEDCPEAQFMDPLERLSTLHAEQRRAFKLQRREERLRRLRGLG